MISLRITALAALAATMAASAAPVIEMNDISSLEHSGKISTGLVRKTSEPEFTATGSSMNSNECSVLELVYFRSSREPQEHLGVIGGPLYAEVLKHVPSASATNIVFNSMLEEQVVTNALAAKEASDHINSKAAACPNQRFVVAGYSKGCIPIHMLMLSKEARERVVASFVVADFYHKHPLGPVMADSWPSNAPDSIISLCHPRDVVCSPGFDSNVEEHTAPHYLPELPYVVKDRIMPLYRRNLRDASKKH